MLRSPQWIADYGAHVGGTIWLNMPEMGVEGEAEVLDIGPAEVYDVRPGLVTGTFRHTSGEVYDLKLESESKPIGVTGTHPFWSVDREAWVSVLDLEIGETLKTLEGTTVVESRVRRPGSEPVYNIEVEGDHVYRVGESGVLVHNASAGCDHRTTHEATFGDLLQDKVGTSASVQVTRRMLVSGTHSTFTAPDWWAPDYNNYVLGHIWASTLGGPGGDAYKNMTPLFRKANNAMRSCEIFAKELVNECCYCIQYDVTVKDYGENERSGRPPKDLVAKAVEIKITAFKSNSPNESYTFTITNSPNANTDPQDCKNVKLPCRK